MKSCKTIEEATELLDYSIDAAVVDLNLGNDTTDGVQVIDELKQHFRIPVAIYTATPSDAVHDAPVIGVFTKGTIYSRMCLTAFGRLSTLA